MEVYLLCAEGQLTFNITQLHRFLENPAEITYPFQLLEGPFNSLNKRYFFLSNNIFARGGFCTFPQQRESTRLIDNFER